MVAYKHVALKPETFERLQALGTMRETFDQLVNRLLDTVGAPPVAGEGDGLPPDVAANPAPEPAPAKPKRKRKRSRRKGVKART